MDSLIKRWADRFLPFSLFFLNIVHPIGGGVSYAGTTPRQESLGQTSN